MNNLDFAPPFSPLIDDTTTYSSRFQVHSYLFSSSSPYSVRSSHEPRLWSIKTLGFAPYVFASKDWELQTRVLPERLGATQIHHLGWILLTNSFTGFAQTWLPFRGSNYGRTKRAHYFSRPWPVPQRLSSIKSRWNPSIELLSFRKPVINHGRGVISNPQNPQPKPSTSLNSLNPPWNQVGLDLIHLLIRLKRSIAHTFERIWIEIDSARKKTIRGVAGGVGR